MARRFHPLLELTVCRLKEFLREPEAVFWVFIFPVLLAVGLGLAFRDKAPDRIPVAVLDGPGAGDTQAILARSPVLLPRVMGAHDGREALRTGKVSLLVEPGPPVVFRFDETRPDSRIARLEADDALERGAGRRDLVPVESQRVTEPGSRYIDFLIPGLLGMNLMGTGIWSLAFSVAMARKNRLLKRLIATPMRRSHFLLAQGLSRLGFLILEVGVLVGFGWVAFGVAVHGSIVLLAAVTLLGAMTFSGIGLLIASRVTTIEGVSGLANFVMLPMWVLSGVFFSWTRFPAQVQPLIRLLPLTALNDALRAVMTEGKTLPAIAPQVLILVGWALVTYLVALKIFRWR
ncbi:MAG: ABC transporter permease [Acidobacteriota bacterium]